MTTVAITMVKDEADIIASTVGHMLAQVDHVIVADNLSTDGTTSILRSMRRRDARLFTVSDRRKAYLQSEKMTGLAKLAHTRYGADWIVPFDADEIWYSPFGRIADVLAALPRDVCVAMAALYDHVATALDSPDGDPVSRLGWRRVEPAPLCKVACRWASDLVIEQGNHGAHYGGRSVDVEHGHLVVRHFPYRTPTQVVRKIRNGAAAYAAAGDAVRADYGAHWRQWGAILEQRGEDAIRELFYTWYWRDEPRAPLTVSDETQPPLIFDPAPR